MPASPEDLFTLRLAGSPDLAPDGERVVAAVQRVGDDRDAYRSQLWLFPVAAAGECSAPRRVGEGGGAEGGGAEGGGAEGPVTAVRWLDNGRLIAVTERRPAPSPGSPVRIDWLRYKSDGAKEFTEPEPELWLFPLDGPAVRLARPAGRITRLAVGRGRVAYTVEPRHCDNPLPGAQVRVLGVASGADDPWWDCPAPVSALAFTEASGQLVAVSSGVPGQSAAPPRVWLVEHGGARMAFAAADVECERALTGDCRPLSRPALIQPLRGGDEIAFLHTLGHDVALFAGNPAAAAAPRRLTPGGWSVTDFSAGGHGRLAVCLESPVTPAEVCLIDTTDGTGPRRLSAVARSWADRLGPVAPEHVAVKLP